eukprot:476296-Prorocentrum_minimum.AAC.1
MGPPLKGRPDSAPPARAGPARGRGSVQPTAGMRPSQADRMAAKVGGGSSTRAGGASAGGGPKQSREVSNRLYPRKPPPASAATQVVPEARGQVRSHAPC